MIDATQRIALGYLDTFSLALHQLDLLDDDEVRSSLARQIYFTGVRALPLISLFALLFGAVVVTSALASLGADNQLALKAVVWDGLRELAPLAAAMIIVSRSSVAIGAELSRDRKVDRDSDGTLHAADDLGYRHAFRVARKRPYTVEPPVANVPGVAQRGPNQRIDFTKPVRPRMIEHVVLRAQDWRKAMDFYVNRLQFRVSDIYTNAG